MPRVPYHMCLASAPFFVFRQFTFALRLISCHTRPLRLFRRFVSLCTHLIFPPPLPVLPHHTSHPPCVSPCAMAHLLPLPLPPTHPPSKYWAKISSGPSANAFGANYFGPNLCFGAPKNSGPGLGAGPPPFLKPPPPRPFVGGQGRHRCAAMRQGGAGQHVGQTVSGPLAAHGHGSPSAGPRGGGGGF